MILADTSVWVDHLRRDNRGLRRLLDDLMVLAHPLVIGELACGSLRNRREFLVLLSALPQAPSAEHEEVLRWMEDEGLYGRGLGWIEVHLLASARPLAAPSGRWTSV